MSAHTSPRAAHLTRRGLLAAGLGATAASALSACGSSATTSGGSASASKSEKHTLTDSLGRKVELSTRPQRIVSLMDWASGAAVLSLGGPLVGMMTREGNKFMPWISEEYDTSKIAPLGTFDQWNVEQIAALKPDLIFASALNGKPNLTNLKPETLAGAGPTYFLENSATNQDEFMNRVGDIIGKRDEVDRQRAAYQKSLAAVKADLEQKAKGLTFADVGWYSPTFWVSTLASPQPLIKVGLQMGLKLPKAASVPGALRTDEIDLSPEQMLQGSADVLFYTADDQDPRKLPLWPRMPAVKAGQTVAMSYRSVGWTFKEYERTLTLLSNALKGARKVTP